MPTLKLAFRLRTLFALVTACAIACATVGVRWLDAQRQRSAVERIGAIPTFERRDVVALLWPAPNVETFLDDRLIAVKDLPHLRRLSLRFAWVTDAGLAHLTKIPQLDELRLGITGHLDPNLDLVKLFGPTYNGQDLTSDVVKRQMRNDLASGMLVIRNIYITDSGMAHVARLRSLRTLSLDATAVGDKGLARLAELPLLEELDLQGTYVTDDGLESLSKFPRLKRLRLGNMRYVTNDGLRHVARVPTLEDLELPSAANDDAIGLLLPLRSTLRRLDVSQCQITADGVSTLQAALPGCDVDTLGSDFAF